MEAFEGRVSLVLVEILMGRWPDLGQERPDKSSTSDPDIHMWEGEHTGRQAKFSPRAMQ
jgi:hypothetical protein